MSYTSLFQSECEKARRFIENKLSRPLSNIEYRSLTRLSNLTFMEMLMVDFESAQSPEQAEQALQNLKKNAEDRFHLAIQELDEKIQTAFGVEMEHSLKNTLKKQGSGLDVHRIQDEVNEHQSVLPKFLRKNKVKKTLENWENQLKHR